MKFERFTGDCRKHHQIPSKMAVGQIVARKKIKPYYVATLKTYMRRAIRDHGMEFSHGWDGDTYAIRRDK